LAAPVARILGSIEVRYAQFAPKALLAYPVVLLQQGRIFREFVRQRHAVDLAPRNRTVLRGCLNKNSAGRQSRGRPALNLDLQGWVW
jgi:hypothetical protein